MLNDKQKSIIDATIAPNMEAIKALSRVDQIKACELLLDEKKLDEKTSQANEKWLKEKNILEEVEFIKVILNHPRPQNRATGNPSAIPLDREIDQKNGEEKNAILNGRVYWWDAKERVSEEVGLLGLTKDNDAKNVANHVTRLDVKNHIRGEINHILQLAKDYNEIISQLHTKGTSNPGSIFEKLISQYNKINGDNEKIPQDAKLFASPKSYSAWLKENFPERKENLPPLSIDEIMNKFKNNFPQLDEKSEFARLLSAFFSYYSSYLPLLDEKIKNKLKISDISLLTHKKMLEDFLNKIPDLETEAKNMIEKKRNEGFKGEERNNTREDQKKDHEVVKIFTGSMYTLGLTNNPFNLEFNNGLDSMKKSLRKMIELASTTENSEIIAKINLWIKKIAQSDIFIRSILPYYMQLLGDFIRLGMVLPANEEGIYDILSSEYSMGQLRNEKKLNFIHNLVFGSLLDDSSMDQDPLSLIKGKISDDLKIKLLKMVIQDLPDGKEAKEYKKNFDYQIDFIVDLVDCFDSRESLLLLSQKEFDRILFYINQKLFIGRPVLAVLEIRGLNEGPKIIGLKKLIKLGSILPFDTCYLRAKHYLIDRALSQNEDATQLVDTLNVEQKNNLFDELASEEIWRPSDEQGTVRLSLLVHLTKILPSILADTKNLKLLERAISNKINQPMKQILFINSNPKNSDYFLENYYVWEEKSESLHYEVAHHSDPVPLRNVNEFKKGLMGLIELSPSFKKQSKALRKKNQQLTNDNANTKTNKPNNFQHTLNQINYCLENAIFLDQKQLEEQIFSNSDHYISPIENLNYSSLEYLIKLIALLPPVPRDLFFNQMGDFLTKSLQLLDNSSVDRLYILLSNIPSSLVDALFYKAFNSHFSNETKCMLCLLVAGSRFLLFPSILGGYATHEEKSHLAESFSPKTKQVMTKFFINQLSPELKVELSAMDSQSKKDFAKSLPLFPRLDSNKLELMNNVSWSLLDVFWPADKNMQNKIFYYFEEKLKTITLEKDLEDVTVQNYSAKLIPHTLYQLRKVSIFWGLGRCWKQLSLVVQDAFLSIIMKNLEHKNAERLLYDILWPILSDSQKSDFKMMIGKKSDTETLNKYRSLTKDYLTHKFYPFTSSQVEYILRDILKKMDALAPLVGKVKYLELGILFQKACGFIAKQGDKQQQIRLMRHIDHVFKRCAKQKLEDRWIIVNLVKFVNPLRNLCPDFRLNSVFSNQQLLNEASKDPEKSKIDYLLRIRYYEKEKMINLIFSFLDARNKRAKSSTENMAKALGRLWDSKLFSVNEKNNILGRLSAGVETTIMAPRSGDAKENEKVIAASLLQRGFYLEVLLRVDPQLNVGSRQELITRLIHSPIINDDLTTLLLNLFKYGQDVDRICWCSALNHRALYDDVISPNDRDQLLSLVLKMHEMKVKLDQVKKVLSPDPVLKVMRSYL